MTSDDHWADWQQALDLGIVGESPDAVRLSRYRWLTPTQSLNAAFPEYMIIQLSPFSKGRDGSWIGWLKDESRVDCPVVTSPRDEEFASVLGERFCDGLFWMLIDELQECWLDREDEGNTVWRMNEWLPRLKPLLSPPQYDSLVQIANVSPPEITEYSASFILPRDFTALCFVHSSLDPKERQRIRQYAPVDG
jgi:hypothetical protein